MVLPNLVTGESKSSCANLALPMSLKEKSQNSARDFRPLREGRGILFVSGLCLTLTVALLATFPPVLVQQAELRLYDIMLSGRSKAPQSTVPVLVGIDEESLKTYGQWPWPRYRLALLVERLQRLGAEVIALDFLMPEPDRTSPEVIMSERKRDGETTAIITTQTATSDSNSQRLAESLSDKASVIGYYFDFNDTDAAEVQQTAPTVPAGMVLTSAASSDAPWPKPIGMMRSIPLLTGVVSAEGFTNVPHDLDGALRRAPLLLSYRGSSYPSLALAAILLASNDRKLRISIVGGETFLDWGKRKIPLDRGGNMLLDFRSEQHPFPYLSAQNILNDSQSPMSLKGKIVLVGPWAKGLGDLHLVPSGSFMPGLTIHATVIDNIIAGTFISHPAWARGAEFFAVVFLGIISTWLLSRPGLMWSFVAVVAVCVCTYLGGRELLLAKGLYLSPLLPMLMPIIIMTSSSLLKYGIETRKVRQRNRDLLDAQDTIIISMSALAEARDRETGKHILRTQRYVEILARELATNPRYRDLDESGIELLTKSAPLHDIGKVGIPDNILHKAGHLTDKEYDVMKSHTLIGVDAITKTIGGTGHPHQNDFLRYAQQMIESHHERWDGSGYPHGLRGEEIPLAGRLMALADVYDALVSRRVYKQGFSHNTAMELILEGAEKQFDPAVVTAFIARSAEFSKVSEDLADTGNSPQ